MSEVLQQRHRPLSSRRARRPEVAPPALRGWIHLACFFLSLPAGMAVVGAAGSVRGRIGAAVYGLGMAAMFGVSAAYHRGRWTASGRRRMRRLDHGTILVMIAGSYTPLCLLALGRTTGPAMLTGVWVAAALGFFLALSGVAEKAVLGLLSYFGLGWAMVLALPELSRQLSGAQVGLLFAGGAIYSLGGFVLGLRRPNPSPAYFGYHEVWHVMVAVACALHYVAIYSVVGQLG